MPKSIVQTCTSKSIGKVASVQTWSSVLDDGEKTLAALQSRMRRIKRSLSVVRKKIESGEPFPIDSTERSAD